MITILKIRFFSFTFIISLLYIFFSFGESFAAQQILNQHKDSIEVLRNNLKSMERSVKEIDSFYEIYDSYTLDSLVTSFNLSLKQTKRLLQQNELENEQSLETLKTTFNKINLLTKFYNEIEFKKDKWASQYHQLWKELFYLRKKLDGLYVQEREEDYNFGGFRDVKTTNIRKKHLYTAYTTIYQEYMNKLKIMGECDYYNRIDLIESALVTSKKVDELFYIEDTRALEKNLRKTDSNNWTALEELILEFKE